MPDTNGLWAGREEWWDIPGYEGSYQASTHGRIRSVNRRVVRRDSKVKHFTSRILTPRVGRNKTLYVVLSVQGLCLNHPVHRLIASTFLGPRPSASDIDHIDGDQANNAPNNLRYCSRSQNMQNQKPRTCGTSRFKGVNWDRSRHLWLARICNNGHQQNLGRFKSERQAAAAYNKAAKEIFGDFALLNILPRKEK